VNNGGYGKAGFLTFLLFHDPAPEQEEHAGTFPLRFPGPAKT
jgi:hypothetical protein